MNPTISKTSDVFYISEEEIKFAYGFEKSGWYSPFGGPFETEKEAENSLLPS
jgi:hypothetical protein